MTTAVTNLRLCYNTLSTRNQSRGDQVPKRQDSQLDLTLLGIDDKKREYAHRLFQCLATSIRPLRVEELAEVLAIRFPEAAPGPPTFNADWHPPDAEEAVLSVCSNLISIVDRERHRVVQFSHFSVKEYLTSERLATSEEQLSYYHILRESAHAILAHASLSVLLQLDDQIDRNTIANFPLAPYAARHLVDHAQFRNVSSHIEEGMKLLFDPTKPHFAAWVWLYDVDRYWTGPMPSVHPMQPEALPLYYASLCGFVSLAEHLIAAYSLDVNSEGGSHMTPLHAASVKGHLEVASLLLRNGADPNSRDHLGRVPLHRVSQGGFMAKSSLEIARLLVNSGADVNVTDDEGCTPLHAAVQSGYREIAELLLGSGASLDVLNKKQETPLALASDNGMLDVSRFLIDQGSDINSRDMEGFIPLHTANANTRNELRSTTLDTVEYDADGDRKDETVRSLHAAAEEGNIDTLRSLLERGADINARDATNQIPLHRAAAKGHVDVVLLLIERGAEVDSCDNWGWTPLHRSSREGHLEVSRTLLDYGANVNARQQNHWTPIYLSASNGYLEIVKLLLERGADLHAINDTGQTPYQASLQTGNREIADLLWKNGAGLLEERFDEILL